MDFDKIGLNRVNKMDSGKPESDGKRIEVVIDHPDIVQKEIMRFNWGAFLMTWIWAAGNKLWLWVVIGLAANAIAFIPGSNNKAAWISLICQLLLSITLGIKGSEWAWKSKKWDSIENFKKTQEKWRKWGLVFTIIGFVIGIIIGAITV